jgi:acyl-CoA-binding protein
MGFVPIGEAVDEGLKSKFLQAADLARSGSINISTDEIQLQLYGLFKQASVGPAGPSEISFWDVVGKAKWEAWSRLGSMSKGEAMAKYVLLVNSLGGDKLRAGKQQNKGWKSTSKMVATDADVADEEQVCGNQREENF